MKGSTACGLLRSTSAGQRPTLSRHDGRANRSGLSKLSRPHIFGPNHQKSDLALAALRSLTFRLLAAQKHSPVCHQSDPPLKEIPTPIGRFDLVAHCMRQGHFSDISAMGCGVRYPVSKRAAKSVHRGFDLHSPKHCRQRHVGQRAPHSREHQIVVAATCQRLEQPNSWLGEWDPVFPPRLHSFGRHRPKRVREVNLGPGQPTNLARTCCRQDRELHRPCTIALQGSETLGECTHRRDRERFMMSDLGQLGRVRQRSVQVSSPPSRVQALTQPSCTRKVQDEFDTGTNARRGLGLGRPDRLQHLDHMRCSDLRTDSEPTTG